MRFHTLESIVEKHGQRGTARLLGVTQANVRHLMDNSLVYVQIQKDGSLRALNMREVGRGKGVSDWLRNIGEAKFARGK